jgi:hypothetical protein
MTDYVNHDPNEFNPGWFGYFIWFATALISLCTAFVHPLGAIVFFIIGIWIASLVARVSNTPEAYERMQERSSRQRRQQRPAEMVYRREVTVSETIYSSMTSYCPRRLEPWELEDKLRQVNFSKV